MYINNDLDYMNWLKGKSIFIFGAGSDGLSACNKLKKYGFDVVAFIDNNVKKQGKLYNDIPIVSLKEAECMSVNNKIYVVASRKYENEIWEQLMNESSGKFIRISQIDFSCNDMDYYDESYFEYQRPIGEIGSKIDISNFKDYIDEKDTVIEFGSGAGFLLNIIKAKEKIGIEINDAARENAKKIGIKSVKYMDEIADGFADVIISTHVLEHTDNPLDILKGLKRKLKKYGKIIFVVPYQSNDYEYHRSNIDNEFWNWNCLTIGNLFKRAGFFVMRVERIMNQMPPNFKEIYDDVGIDMLECISTLYSDYSKSESIRIIAR